MNINKIIMIFKQKFPKIKFMIILLTLIYHLIIIQDRKQHIKVIPLVRQLPIKVILDR